MELELKRRIDEFEMTPRYSLGILYLLATVMLTLATFPFLTIEAYDAAFGVALFGIIGIIGTAYGAEVGKEGDVRRQAAAAANSGAQQKGGLMMELKDALVLMVIIFLSLLAAFLNQGHELVLLHVEIITIAIGVFASVFGS